MSLSTFLQQPEVRDKFSREFIKPRLVRGAGRRELLAPPLSHRHSLVGTAFDYLLRFYIQRRNPDAVGHRWVAEAGIDMLNERAMGSAHFSLDTEEPVLPAKDKRLDKAREIFNKAVAAYKRYISSGRITDELLKGVIYLAQLDVIYRSGFVDEFLGRAFPEDVKDLRNLISLVRPQEFKAENRCCLNPTFGSASRLVGGADADLLIDDTLIDIKTTMHFRIDREHFNQLLGYFMLNELAGIDGIKPKPKITKIAIYFARHARLQVFELNEIVDPRTFPRFLKEFSKMAGQFTSRRTRRSTGRAKTARALSLAR